VVGAGVVICLERGADLHMAQLMPLSLTVSCYSKIQIGFTFLVLAHPGGPGKKGAIKWVCVCVCSVVYLHYVPGISDLDSTASSDQSYDVASSNWQQQQTGDHSALLSAINGFNKTSLRPMKSVDRAITSPDTDTDS